MKKTCMILIFMIGGCCIAQQLLPLGSSNKTFEQAQYVVFCSPPAEMYAKDFSKGMYQQSGRSSLYEPQTMAILRQLYWSMPSQTGLSPSRVNAIETIGGTYAVIRIKRSFPIFGKKLYWMEIVSEKKFRRWSTKKELRMFYPTT